jgi:nitroreductase
MIKKILILLLTVGSVSAQENLSFSELTLKRYSPYEFDASREVSPDKLIIIANATRNSPSSYNEQPWTYIICDKKLTRKAYEDLFGCLGSKNQSWAKDAPVLILCVAKTISPFNNKPNSYAEYDTGSASVTLSYSATTVGLQAHQMGGFNKNKVSQLFSLPPTYKPMTIIALGYTKTQETPPKKRKALNEVFFWGSLKQGLN